MADGKKCNNSKCDVLVTDIRKKDGQYKKYCSLSCQRLGVVEKCRQTSLEKYGVTNPSKSKKIIQKIKDTNIERYGVSNPSLVPEFLQKIKDTNVEKYGTEKPQLLPEIEDKSKKTCFEKFGTEKPQKLKEFKDKTKETCNKKYGGDSPQCNKDIRQKAVDTCMRKYGVENAGNLPFVRQKIEETSIKKYGVKSPNQDPAIHRKQDGSRFRNKEFIFPSGRIDMVQGDEPHALNQLIVDGYTEIDILTETVDMPQIWFFDDNKKHRYFPDIYIPKDNLIIEVKSTYTFDKDKIKNLLKRQACIDAGYNFKFMIFNGRKNLQVYYEDK